MDWIPCEILMGLVVLTEYISKYHPIFIFEYESFLIMWLSLATVKLVQSIYYDFHGYRNQFALKTKTMLFIRVIRVLKRIFGMA